MFYTSLNKIWAQGPCNRGWETLLNYLGKTEADDEPLSFHSILQSNGLDDAIWALQSIEAPEVRMFAIRSIRQRFPIINNSRIEWALDTAELYTAGLADDADLYWAKVLATDEAYAAAPGTNESDAIRGAICAIDGCAGYVSWDPEKAMTKAITKDFIEIFCS